MLLLNIGNTHTQAARLAASAAGPVLDAVFPTASLLERETRQRQFAAYAGESCLAACVVPAVRTALEQCSELNVQFLDSSMVSEIDFSLVDTSTLGSDRVANACAGLSMTKPPFIVLDCGTAITTEVVDGQSRFRGGAIMPGRILQRLALHEQTGQLPNVPLQPRRPAALGTNTKDAILAGIDLAVLAAVESLLEETRIEADIPGAEVLVTGGDAEFFTENLALQPKPETTAADFTLRGLARAARLLAWVLVIMISVLCVRPAAAQQVAVPDPSQLELTVQLEARATARRSTAFLLRHQQKNGSWADDPALTSRAAVLLLNSPDYQAEDVAEAVGRAVDYVRNWVAEDGYVETAGEKDGPDTAAVAAAVLVLLREEGDERQMLPRMCEYMLRLQVTEKDSAGFGGFPAVPGDEPDVLTTAAVVRALRLCAGTGAAAEEEIEACMRRAQVFFADCQFRNAEDVGLKGGFRVKPGADVESASMADFILWTAAGARGLLLSGAVQSDQVEAALLWLKRSANTKKVEDSKLPVRYQATKELAELFVVATRIVSADLLITNWRESLALPLIVSQRSDGGWGTGEGSSVEATLDALTVLLITAGG